MKLSKGILTAALAIIGIFLTLQINNAFAEPTVLTAGDDFYPNSMYDFRTYHESHPKFGLPNNSGSNWIIGLTVHNPAVWDSIGEVNLIQDGTIEDMQYTIRIDHAAVYPWGGQMFHDWSVWLNNLVMLPVDRTFEITAKDNLGNPIVFNMDGINQDSVFANVDTDSPLPPVCKIKRMAIKKNGELKMRFTAPYDIRQEEDRNVHIRIRIFDAEDNGLEHEMERIYPPFQIVKKDGTIIPDKVKVTNIPAEYAGRTGRIEYRVNADSGVLFRGITYFKLPELEDDEE